MNLKYLFEFCNQEDLPVEVFLRVWGGKNLANQSYLTTDKELEELGLLNKGLISLKANLLLQKWDTFYALKVRGDIQDDFEIWWNTYPNTDRHALFPSTKPLKSNKPFCKKVYRELIEEGYSAEELLHALEAEIRMRKANSVERNELYWMLRSDNYLDKRVFESFLDQQHIEQEESQNRENTYGRLL